MLVKKIRGLKHLPNQRLKGSSQCKWRDFFQKLKYFIERCKSFILSIYECYHSYHYCYYYYYYSPLRYLTDSDGGGVLPLTDDVMKQSQDKHPKAQPAALGSLLFGPVEDVHESVYSEVTGG